jgi:tRNA(Ile)-lysidine synthase
MAILSCDLVERAAEILNRYSMLSRGDRVGVAVSGGVDSVTLLHILHRLATRFDIKLAVVHVNHQLRGNESNQDEQFVRQLADSLNLEIFVDSGAVEGSNLEQRARDARRQFFFRLLHRDRAVTKIALGHTRSDQAETVLFRFLKGSGLAGLAGMRLLTPERLLRPLLTSSRQEVRTWAESEGLGWREDSSNLDLRFSRNRLRHSTIPALTLDYNSELESALTRTAELAGDEEDFWTDHVAKIFRAIARKVHLGWILPVSDLMVLHIAVQRRLMRYGLFVLRGSLRGIEMQHVDAILALCQSHQGHDRVLVPGADAIRSFGQLLLAARGALNSGERHYQFNLSFGEELALPYRSGSLCVNWVRPELQICANFKGEKDFLPELVDFDGDRINQGYLQGLLCVRNWEPGDELHRTGHRGAEKIKSLFQEYRVPLWMRRHWPVVVCGDEIAWTRQFGGAVGFTASKEHRLVVRLTYLPQE